MHKFLIVENQSFFEQLNSSGFLKRPYSLHTVNCFQYYFSILSSDLL